MNLYIVPSARAKALLEVVIGKLVEDYTKAFKELEALAKIIGIDITPDDLSAFGSRCNPEINLYVKLRTQIKNFKFIREFGEFRMIEGVKPEPDKYTFTEEEFKLITRIYNDEP